ncbi:hypothetical protein J437_LFUL005909 [Ladona fulva]|uniref:N-acetylneuraminate-9-phosphate synthase n=1 Tax=Ladona fulva TaxID=123851 RepID=A0A8K0KA88_LADFU|nr:hypothetical protein J437_LFUL005909 [Ladona fulva]
MTKNLELCSGKYVGNGYPCFIIAEVGQNHQGNIDIAKMLIETAKKGGADCVKFQKSHLNSKFNAAALARKYHETNSWGETYGDHKSYLEFSVDQFIELQTFAHSINIPFTASPMDEVSLELLNSMDVPFIKIGSGDANNFPLLRKAAETGRPIVLSTGMQSMSSIRNAVSAITEVQRRPRLCLLQCTSSYPTPPNQAHLRVMETFRKEFPDVHIGYSGHEKGYAISLAAVALGAKVIERHITFDKTAKGSDHTCSLEPEEFTRFVKDVREVEAALGNPDKVPLPCEYPVIKKLGKTLVATKDLSAGTILNQSDIVAKVAEPQGISAENILSVIGKKLLKDVKCDESILFHDLLYE